MVDCFKSSYIANLINGESTHDDILINNFSSLCAADSDSICFYNEKKYKDDLLNTNAALVVMKKSDSILRSGPSIYVDDPYLAYAKISNLFINKLKKKFVHKTASIDKTSKLDPTIYVGPNSTIGSHCLIGKDTQIGPNVSIQDNVIIGNNVIIHSNVSIENDTIIGDDCQISSGARIGNDGFGYARELNGKWLKIPQIGKVIIGKNVDIGANSTIDRGAIEDTIIEDGVKLDNLVQIAHNCLIGENTVIAGCAAIAGSTKVGKNCMIGGAAMIKGHIEIADGTIISGGTGIGKNITEQGKRFTNVFPYNLEHKDWLKIATKLKKLGKKNE